MPLTSSEDLAGSEMPASSAGLASSTVGARRTALMSSPSASFSRAFSSRTVTPIPAATARGSSLPSADGARSPRARPGAGEHDVAVRQHDLDVAPLALAQHDRHVTCSTGGVSATLSRKLLHVVDGLAVELDDDVAAAQARLARPASRSTTFWITTPCVARRRRGRPPAPASARRAATPSHGALDLAARDQLLGDVLGEVDRDREADALAAGVDRGVDADRLAADVAQRAARVAEVDRRVGLDEVLVVGRAAEDVEVRRGPAR